MARAKVILYAIFLLALAGALTFMLWVRSHRFGTQGEPSWAERSLARYARKMAMPDAARNLKNPNPLTPESLAHAREHWVAHCSTCHAIDGRGNTPIGRNLFPRVPDLTALDTQQRTDGELFFIISNGVRFTGMPGWGREDTPESIWELVGFIRRLPRLDPKEIEAMRSQSESGSTASGKSNRHAPGTPPHKH